MGLELLLGPGANRYETMPFKLSIGLFLCRQFFLSGSLCDVPWKSKSCISCSFRSISGENVTDYTAFQSPSRRVSIQDLFSIRNSESRREFDSDFGTSRSPDSSSELFRSIEKARFFPMVFFSSSWILTFCISVLSDISTVCRPGLLGEIPDLLGSVKDDGVNLDQTMAKVLLDSLIRSGKFDSALEVLDDMEELGDCLNPSLYDSVLIALVKKNELRLTISIFFNLLEASDGHSDETSGVIVSYIPGMVAVNELLGVLRRADMRLEFKRVFDKLKSMKRFKFDTWGFNICIHGFGCWGDLDTALSLFKEMKEQSSVSGSSVGPDICTYITA